jgi:chromosome segregation ATPase
MKTNDKSKRIRQIEKKLEDLQGDRDDLQEKMNTIEGEIEDLTEELEALKRPA